MGQRGQLGLADGGREALHGIVAGVHLHDQPGPLAQGIGVVGQVGAVVVPTSTMTAPALAITSGMRKAPPISTSSPRETITSRPGAPAPRW